MKIASSILFVLRNKYLVTLLGFLLLMIFFDHNNLFVQLDRKAQLNDLLSSRKFYQTQINKTKKQLSDLQNNSTAIEKYARENFYMKRSNEDVFVVQNMLDSSKK